MCPEVVTAKDTPCKVDKPTATIVVRDIIKPSTDVELENKALKEMIERLIEKIEHLEKQNATK